MASKAEQASAQATFNANFAAIAAAKAQYGDDWEGAYTRVTGKKWPGGTDVKISGAQGAIVKDPGKVNTILGKYVLPAAGMIAAPFTGGLSEVAIEGLLGAGAGYFGSGRTAKGALIGGALGAGSGALDNAVTGGGVLKGGGGKVAESAIKNLPANQLGVSSPSAWGKVGKFLDNYGTLIAQGVTPLIATKMANDAMTEATQIQSDAATESARIEAETYDKALAEQKRMYDIRRADLEPYRVLGQGAAAGWSNLMGIAQPNLGPVSARPTVQQTMDYRGQGTLAPPAGPPGTKFEPTYLPASDPRSGAFTPGPPAASGGVQTSPGASGSVTAVRAPNGQTYKVPQADLQDALAHGGTVVQGLVSPDQRSTGAQWADTLLNGPRPPGPVMY
jgi:hypothetical protein